MLFQAPSSGEPLHIKKAPRNPETPREESDKTRRIGVLISRLRGIITFETTKAENRFQEEKQYNELANETFERANKLVKEIGNQEIKTSDERPEYLYASDNNGKIRLIHTNRSPEYGLQDEYSVWETTIEATPKKDKEYRCAIVKKLWEDNKLVEAVAFDTDFPERFKQWTELSDSAVLKKSRENPNPDMFEVLVGDSLKKMENVLNSLTKEE